MSKKRYSKNFERDYAFYESNMDKFSFAGTYISIEPTVDKKPVDAKKAFFMFDSTGRIFPCTEPEKFHNILRCKKAINLQIKAWVQGFADCIQTVDELLESFEGEVPPWVREAICNQIKKTYGMTSDQIIYLNYKEHYESLLQNKQKSR